MACGPGSPELSESYMDMASKLFTFTFTLHDVRSVLFFTGVRSIGMHRYSKHAAATSAAEFEGSCALARLWSQLQSQRHGSPGERGEVSQQL